jgi:hypothetical protein
MGFSLFPGGGVKVSVRVFNCILPPGEGRLQAGRQDMVFRSCLMLVEFIQTLTQCCTSYLSDHIPSQGPLAELSTISERWDSRHLKQE